MESNHDKGLQNGKKKYLVSDYKRALWNIDIFAMAGAKRQVQGPDDESNQKKMEGSDGGAGETKEDPEEYPEEAASPKP